MVLVDFGAAKHATATLLAKTGTGIGKPSYGAPEQMLGKSVFQSDLFGLGVTCLHLLTNVEPFTLYDVLENEYQWRQFLNGKVVSDRFGKLLDRMTAYRVKERPTSVTEVLQESGVKRKTSNPVNISTINSYESEYFKEQCRLESIANVSKKQTVERGDFTIRFNVITCTLGSIICLVLAVWSVNIIASPNEFKFTYRGTKIDNSSVISGIGFFILATFSITGTYLSLFVINKSYGITISEKYFIFKSPFKNIRIAWKDILDISLSQSEQEIYMDLLLSPDDKYVRIPMSGLDTTKEEIYEIIVQKILSHQNSKKL